MPVDHRGAHADDFVAQHRHDHEMPARLAPCISAFGVDRFVKNVDGDIAEQCLGAVGYPVDRESGLRHSASGDDGRIQRDRWTSITLSSHPSSSEETKLKLA